MRGSTLRSARSPFASAQKTTQVDVHPRASYVRVEEKDLSAASELLKSYDARLLRCYPVSTRINHVANDEGCSKPVELGEIQSRLFA